MSNLNPHHREVLGKLDVLVVDDISVVRNALARILRSLGIRGRIDKAEDGFKAWEMIQTYNYGLVVSDIQMPRMTGLELKKIVRTTPRFAELPFLMITGEVSEDILANVKESRFDGFLLKPFHRVVLEARLRELLNIPR